MCFLTAQLGGGEKAESKQALNVLELLSRDANSAPAGWRGGCWGCSAALVEPHGCSLLHEAVAGVRTGLGLLLSLHTRGPEQQRAVPGWKLQPEKDANDTQRGMNAALESCCERGASIKGGKKPQTKPWLPLPELQSRERAELLPGAALWGGHCSPEQPPLSRALSQPVCRALFGSSSLCFRAR